MSKKIFLLIILIIASIITYPTAFNAQGEEKTVLNVYSNYNPPPVGHFNFFAPGHIPEQNFVLEPLTHLYLANDTYVPGIAENWTLSEDYKTLTIKIRKGVKWHDGTEFTTKDIRAMWLMIAITNPGYPFPTQIIDSITIIDDYTIVFKANKAHAGFAFGILWHYDYVPYHQYKTIVDKIVARMKEGKNPFAHPEDFTDIKNELLNFRPDTYIGTGPYKVKKVTEEAIILEKFKDYWNGEPAIDEVHIIRTPSGEVLWSLLLEGKLDWYWGTPTPEQLDQLKSKPFFGTVKIARWIGPMLYFNKRKYPLSLVKVRQAIAYAINRTEIAYIEWPIGGIPTKYIIGFAPDYATLYFNESFMNNYVKKFTYDYNPSKAEQLLKELGFTKGADGIYVTPNGTKLEFELAVDGWLKPESCEAIAAMLEKVGIKLTIRTYERGVFWADDGPFKQGRYDIAVGVFGGASFSFSEYFYKYNKLFPGHGYPEIQQIPWKFRGSNTVNVSELVEIYQTFPAEISEEERNFVYAILAYLTGSQVVVLPLAGRPVIIAYNKEKFTGWPPADDPFWASLRSYMTRGRSYLVRWNLIKPLLSLTISVEPSGGGTTDPAAGTYTYARGATITVKAIAASGYNFEKWVLDGKDAGTSPTITVTMDKSHTLKAVFSRVPYELYAGIVILVIIILVVIYYVFKKRKTPKTK